MTPAIWLSHTTLGYTVAHSAIDWGDEGQLFNTSEQQVLLSSWLFSYLISVPPKKVSCLVAPARRFKPGATCPHSPCMPFTQPWQTCEAGLDGRCYIVLNDKKTSLLLLHNPFCTRKEPLGGLHRKRTFCPPPGFAVFAPKGPTMKRNPHVSYH